MRTNSSPIAIMRRSCSDSPPTVSQLDRVFGSDRQLLVHGMGFSPDHRTIAVVAIGYANGMFAYVTIGGLNEIKVFRTDNFEQVATIPVGKLPHGIWPSGDGTRVYVGLENEDKVAAIDTLKNEAIATSPIGQAPQALLYAPDSRP